MTLRTLTVEIPESVYLALKHRAERSSLTVAEELARAAQREVASAEQLPPEYETALSGLQDAKDDQLWATARNRLSAEQARRLEELHHLKGERELSADEEDEARTLLGEYDRCVLLRARAMELLKSRGHDISVLLQP